MYLLKFTLVLPDNTTKSKVGFYEFLNTYYMNVVTLENLFKIS